MDVLRRLAARRRIEQPGCVVVAHPDDETIGAGGVLRLFAALTVVHVTDGAPRNLDDARAAGFADARDYAAARRDELGRAMAAGGLRPRLVDLAVADQGASLEMGAIAASLEALFAGLGARWVLTHPYEGGHPDHDATCRAVHGTCARLGEAAPEIVEMAFYHAHGDGMATGAFLGPPGIAVELTAAEQQTKQRMLACFATQRATLAAFGTGRELFRAAPRYDFGSPPHPGRLHYERHDWGMTGARWRVLAADAGRGW